MSYKVIEQKAIDILLELQKIKSRSPKVSNLKELDHIKNALLKKIVSGDIDPKQLTVENLMYGCQILETEAEEIYAYLKTVEFI